MTESTGMNSVHLTHYSKLMQNYEAETPVSVEGPIVAVRDSAGKSALFTVGSAGKVYCLRADAASDTGWSQSFTGVTVNTAANNVDPRKIAAALDRDKLILFAISSDQLSLVYVKEGGTGWTPPREVGETRGHSPILAVTAQQPATRIVVNFFVSAFPSTNPRADGYGPYTGWSGGWLPERSKLDDPFQFQTEDFELTAVATSTNNPAWIGARSPQIYTRYTTKYSRHVITDHGSGTHYNFEVYRPIPDDGFFIVGDVALQVGKDYPHHPPANPTLTIASTEWNVIGQPEPDPATTKFTYRQIWNDRHSHADMDSSIFTAEANGYANLGHVFKDGQSSAPPEKVPLAIVRDDLVSRGKVYNPRPGTHDERNNQNMIYMNIDGHGSPAPMSMDRITPAAGAVSAGTFYAHQDHNIPIGPAYSLNRDRVVHSAVVEWEQEGDSRGTGAAISRLTSSSITQLSVARDMQGNNRFAVLLADGRVMLHDPAAKNWIVAEGRFVSIALSTNASGSLEMFAIDDKRRIVHTRISDEGWGTIVPLDNRVQYARLALTKSADGHTECYATGAGKSVTRIFQDPSTTNWAIEDIALMDVDHVVEIYTYTTEVHLTDLTGVPLRNLAVSLSSDDLVKATVNGAVNLLEDGVFTPFQTDATGCLTIVYSTTSLNAPVFHLKAPGMDVDEHCAIEMNAGVHGTLKNVSPQTLKDRFHTSEDNASHAAMAISSVMSLKVVDKQNAPPHLRLTSPSGGLHYRKSSIAAPLKLSTAGIPEQSFRIEMSKGTVRFTPLPASAAADGFAQDMTARDPRDVFSWLKDIGDMAAAVAEAIVDTVVYHVCAAVEGVLASVRFVIGKITYEFNQVIDRIEHLFDIVSVVFTSISAAFDEVVKWVGFLFSWDDILITKDALSHLVTETLPVLKTAAEFIRTRAVAGISYAKTSLQGIVEGFVRDHIGAGDDLANAKAPDITEARDSMSGTNIFLSGFVARPDSATMVGRMTRSDLDPAVNDLFNLLKQQNSENGSFAKSTGFANAQRIFEAIPGNPDQFLTLATSALINTLLGIAEAALELAAAVVDKFCSAIAGVVDWVLKMIQTPIEIPVLSKIYADYVIGNSEAKLTILDLCSLICAIPATIAAKLVTGDVQTGILKDRAQLDQLKTLYTSRWLEAKSGLSSSSAQRAMPRDADEPAWFRRTLSLLSGMSNFAAQFVFGVIEGILDTVSLDPLAKITEPSPWVGLVAVSLGFILFATSCPYLMNPKNSGSLAFDRDGIAFLMWLTTGILLPVTDAAFFAYSFVHVPPPKKGLIARNTEYYGAGTDFTLTLIALGGSILALAIGGIDDALIFALSVVTTVMFGFTALRVIRLPPISRAVSPTNPFLAPGIASVVDLVADWGTAACVLITTKQYFQTSSSATT